MVPSSNPSNLQEYEQVSHSNTTMEREIERLKQERIKLQQTLNQHQCAIQQQQQNRGGHSLLNTRTCTSSSMPPRGGTSTSMLSRHDPMRPTSTNSSGFLLQGGTRKEERSGENVRRLYCTYTISLGNFDINYVILVFSCTFKHFLIWLNLLLHLVNLLIRERSQMTSFHYRGLDKVTKGGGWRDQSDVIFLYDLWEKFYTTWFIKVFLLVNSVDWVIAPIICTCRCTSMCTQSEQYIALIVIVLRVT